MKLCYLVCPACGFQNVVIEDDPIPDECEQCDEPLDDADYFDDAE